MKMASQKCVTKIIQQSQRFVDRFILMMIETEIKSSFSYLETIIRIDSKQSILLQILLLLLVTVHCNTKLTEAHKAAQASPLHQSLEGFSLYSLREGRSIFTPYFLYPLLPLNSFFRPIPTPSAEKLLIVLPKLHGRTARYLPIYYPSS